MTKKEYLFLHTLPMDYEYGKDKNVDLQMTEQVFTNRGLDISGLSLYAFDVYYSPEGQLLICCLAGDKIHKSERGGWIEMTIRNLANEHDPQNATTVANRLYNLLVDNGAMMAMLPEFSDIDIATAAITADTPLDWYKGNFNSVLDTSYWTNIEKDLSSHA
ncbi:hypothetical protein D3C78_20120 [compost metagenome]